MQARQGVGLLIWHIGSWSDLGGGKLVPRRYFNPIPCKGTMQGQTLEFDQKMSIKTTTALLLLLALSACSKNTTTAPDAADQFVGTYTGTASLYQGTTLISKTTVSDYTITKMSATQILIGSGGNTAVANVSGSTFTCHYQTVQNNTSITVDETGNLSGTSLAETGTSSGKDLTTGTVTNYTFSSTFTKQ